MMISLELDSLSPAVSCFSKTSERAQRMGECALMVSPCTRKVTPVVRTNLQLELHREGIVLHPLGGQELLVGQPKDAHFDAAMPAVLLVYVRAEGPTTGVCGGMALIASGSPLHVLATLLLDEDSVAKGDAIIVLMDDCQGPMLLFCS
eukprot:Skav216203  [mRNA]  locus=scaffold238:97538:103588:+ [translate_table: standard]